MKVSQALLLSDKHNAPIISTMSWKAIRSQSDGKDSVKYANFQIIWPLFAFSPIFVIEITSCWGAGGWHFYAMGAEGDIAL